MGSISRAGSRAERLGAESRIARAVARFGPTLLVILLLVATAAAFAVTERLKLVRSPILDTRIERKIFSPVCGCERDRTAIGFRLREADRVTVGVIDSTDEIVRTLVEDDETPGGSFEIEWDGRDDAGRVVPEGSYKPRVHLAEQRIEIDLPNPIRVDTTPPRVLPFRVAPSAFSPDGDGHNDKIRVTYRLSESARVLVYVDGERRVRSKARRPDGKVDWSGIVGGKPLRAGRYEVTLAAEDTAGNVGEQTAPVTIVIRYVELAKETIRVRAQSRFRIRVDTDAESFRWRFAGGRGTGRPDFLVLRAPRNPGRYTLFVEVNGHGDRARVIVGR
jgi:hypothetical protein